MRSFIGGGAPVNRSLRGFQSPRGRAMRQSMGQDRVERAIGRIESALERIEGAAARAAAAARPDDGALREAHEALRRRVRDALAQLDGLIEAAEAR
jgi:hypothetical protein